MIKHTLIAVLCLGITCLASRAEDMQPQVNQSAAILKDFISGSNPTIPSKMLASAKGLVIMKVTKGGFIFTGSSGDGVIIKRLKGGWFSAPWSGPAALSTSGGGFGLQAGGEVIELVLVLTSDSALREFSSETEIKFGGEIKGTAGPDSSHISETWTPTAPVYVYSRSDGLFGGLSVKGTVFEPEKDKNLSYYGKAVTTREILDGKVKPPTGAKVLLDLLKKK